MTEPTDYAVVSAMRVYGGHFIRILADLCDRADPVNLAKIKATWPEYWAEFVALAKDRIERLGGPK